MDSMSSPVRSTNLYMYAHMRWNEAMRWNEDVDVSEMSLESGLTYRFLGEIYEMKMSIAFPKPFSIVLFLTNVFWTN